MSIDYITTDVIGKTILVYFKPWEGEIFPEINGNTLTINIRIDDYTGTIEELKNYKVGLYFSSIQVIKLLTDSDSYFLESVTALSQILVNYTITYNIEGEIYDTTDQFLTNNFEIYLTDCLLINGSIENKQIIPINSDDLFNYNEDNELHIKLSNCLTTSIKAVFISNMQCINCYHSGNTSLIISGAIPPELAKSREVYSEDNEILPIYSINKPPVSNITNLPIPINTSGDNASSIDLTKITF